MKNAFNTINGNEDMCLKTRKIKLFHHFYKTKLFQMAKK